MTPDRLKNRRLVGLFLLGWILYNYPFLSLFNLPGSYLGIPILFCYIFLAWAGLIVLVIFITQSGNRPEKPGPDPHADN
jgi:hypothetical protein